MLEVVKAGWAELEEVEEFRRWRKEVRIRRCSNSLQEKPFFFFFLFLLSPSTS